MQFLHPIRAAFRQWKIQRLNRFLHGAGEARKVQHRVLLEKIARAERSDFGREHGFNQIRSVADFRRQLPVTDYEAHRPYIDRVMRGEVQAMFNPGTKLWMFAMTSGTTSAPKHLPVTDAFYREYKASWQMWGSGVYRDYPKLIGLLTLQLSSHWQVDRAPSGVPCGNISGLAAETRPSYIRSLFVLPSAVVRIMDPSAKHYTALRLGIATPKIGMLITANPSTFIEFAKRGNAEKQRLIRDIYDGGLDCEIPATIRQALAPQLTANKQRARDLERIVNRTGNLHPKEVWPNLQLMAVWTGGSVGIYLPQLPEYYGDVPIRDHGMSASEGRMSIPLADGVQPGILDYASHFYEFIPEEEYGSAHANVLEAHELERDKRYFILLTTSAGLYRYDIADMVQCDGYVGQSPLLRFVNKARNFSSFTGEKLSEYQVVQAMRESFQALELPTCTFTIAPIMEGKPRYRILLTPGIQAERGAELAAEAQRRLEQINVEYRDKCQSGRLTHLGVHVLPSGTWEAMREVRSRQRGNFEEFKHPCLTNDLNFIGSLPVPTSGLTTSDPKDAAMPLGGIS